MRVTPEKGAKRLLTRIEDLKRMRVCIGLRPEQHRELHHLESQLGTNIHVHKAVEAVERAREASLRARESQGRASVFLGSARNMRRGFAKLAGAAAHASKFVERSQPPEPEHGEPLTPDDAEATLG